MIVKLFGVFGLMVAWAVFIIAIAPLCLLACVITVMLPFVSDETDTEISSWQWPDKYAAFITKITGVKV